MRIIRRIDNLQDRLERVKLDRANMPPADALSVSLWELGAEMAALDADGLAKAAEIMGTVPPGPENKAAAPGEINGMGLTAADVRELALTYSR